MAYWQWGDPTSPDLVVCVHGLSRQGRDFDVLARALCSEVGSRIRVVCPDVVGRGRSDWLNDPMAYQIPTYVADMLALLTQLQPQRLDWVGTSMGGLIGIALSGQKDIPLPAPMRRLVLNDVGPVIEWQALQRIAEYLGQTGLFASVQEAADALWASSTTFGPHTPEQWLAFSRPMCKPAGDAKGSLTLHYDPAIAIPLAGVSKESVTEGQALLWQLYDQISATTLLLRGAESDLLSIDTAQAMTLRGPKARLLEFAGVGHAPTLINDAQVQSVLEFLLETGSTSDEEK
jgi:pimeloyl-ACP methyl ester carboxylesterase